MEYFAGIGSRECPQEILYIIRDASKYFSQKGYILRSGGANGCDDFAEKGVDSVGGEKEIYLPWKYFNDNLSELYPDNLPNFYKAREIAAKYHPAWDRLRDSVKKLMSRNSMQVLGKNLDTPVKFVLCYCPIENGEWKGGTAQALRIADDLNIPIINLYLEEHLTKIKKKIYTND
jgi:hypothetical protein